VESNITAKTPVGKPMKMWVNEFEIVERLWERESPARQVWKRHLKDANARLPAVKLKKKKKKKKKKKEKKKEEEEEDPLQQH
jgi:hypothetical protein